MKLRVKKWDEFQHYKDRSPPWIKLHKGWLDDRAFQRLPDASRALAPCLWLLASESKDGIFNGSVEEVAFRVRQSEAWTEKAINPLISTGFLIVVQDASEPLAERLQDACLETEAETETETTLSGKPDPKAILEFLNEKTGRKFEPLPANLDLIKARLREASEDDIRSVIVVKCRQWAADEKMAQYLRPATLFNRAKFANYLGELSQSAPPSNLKII